MRRFFITLALVSCLSVRADIVAPSNTVVRAEPTPQSPGPYQLIATTVASNQVLLVWKTKMPVRSGAGYRVEVLAPPTYSVSSHWREIASIPSTSSNYTHESSVANLSTYRVRGHLWSSWSNLSGILPVVDKPVFVSWQDLSDNEIEFAVRRITGSVTQQVAVTQPNITTYIDAAPVAGITNSYQIRSHEFTPYSNEAAPFSENLGVISFKWDDTNSVVNAFRFYSTPSAVDTNLNSPRLLPNQWTELFTISNATPTHVSPPTSSYFYTLTTPTGFWYYAVTALKVVVDSGTNIVLESPFSNKPGYEVRH
jgi:hypothetical protein